MVGTGQLHVVQRLPARQLDLAGVEKIHRSRPRPLAAGYSQKTRVHQRKKSLRHRHPAPVAIGSSQIVAVSWRAGGRKQSDSAPFFSRRLFLQVKFKTGGFMPARYGSDLVVDLLKILGIEYVALNPGSSFRGIHDSL